MTAGTNLSTSKYTRFERARIIGARALQIAMGAPVLIEHPAGLMNPVELGMLEFNADVIPITVKRTVPPRSHAGSMRAQPGGR